MSYGYGDSPPISPFHLHFSLETGGPGDKEYMKKNQTPSQGFIISFLRLFIIHHSLCHGGHQLDRIEGTDLLQRILVHCSCRKTNTRLKPQYLPPIYSTYGANCGSLNGFTRHLISSNLTGFEAQGADSPQVPASEKRFFQCGQKWAYLFPKTPSIRSMASAYLRFLKLLTRLVVEEKGPTMFVITSWREYEKLGNKNPTICSGPLFLVL